LKLNIESWHPSGAVRDIHSTGHPVLNASGDLIELVGTVIDITEAKRAEESCAPVRVNIANLVDTTPAFVHTALPNGELDFLNRGLAGICRRSANRFARMALDLEDPS